MRGSDNEGRERDEDLDRNSGEALPAGTGGVASAKEGWAAVKARRGVGFVYLIGAENGLVKIGHSRDPARRAAALSIGGADVALIHQIQTDDPFWLESLLHQKYASLRRRGEWFDLPQSAVDELLHVSVWNRPGPPRRKRARYKRRRRLRIPLPTIFGLRLKALRESAGLTQAELAKLAGMNMFGVAKLEQRVCEPHWPNVMKLCEALGVTPDAFV